MKYRLLIFFVLTTSFSFGQDYKPFFQNNNSLEFTKFLSGVSHAYVMLEDKDVQFIVDNPSSGNAYAIIGLISYLRSIGFEDVKWGIKANKPQSFSSICEQVVIWPSWKYQNNNVSEISMTFISCNDDLFTFKSSNIDWFNHTNSVSWHNTFMKLYGYYKGSYSSYNRLTLSSEMTTWTEEKLKSHFKSNGSTSYEGIYEHSKLKLGSVKTEGGYDLIYFSGATNYIDWNTGELKAKLYPTATPTLFKVDWKMGNKEINKDSYITFEKGLMNLITQDGENILFLKLFPLHSDNNNSIISGPVSGTGFAITSDGLIVTNHHVINGAKKIKIKGVNGDFSKYYNVKIVIEDKNNDLALLKIDDISFTNLGTIPFVINGKTIDVGNLIFVLGYPLRASMGDEIKLTNGIISSKSGFQGDITAYQISAAIQPGNSGGPLFDEKGNLIGIINAKHAGAENASYAIKSTYLLNLFDLMDIYPKIQTVSSVNGKTLTEQVKILKNFTYIIETN